MPKTKLIPVRITTIPITIGKLLEGQLAFMKNHFEVVAISAEKVKLEAYGKEEGVRVFHLEITQKITSIKDIIVVFKLYRLFKKEKPSIVYAHTQKAGIIGIMAAWLAGISNRLHTVVRLPLIEASGFKRKVLNFVEKLTESTN